MRILYCSDDSSDHNRRFVSKLSAAGHQVFFFDLSCSSPADYPFAQNVVHIGHGIRWERASDPESVKRFLPEFRSTVARIRPDLIHAGPVQSCGYLAALADFHPLVVMSWGSDLLIDANRGPQWVHATQTALRRADGFMCDCEAVRNAARKHSSLPDWRIAQFPWGISAGAFSPQGSRAEIPFGPETVRFICTRSWEPIYGMGTLLKAFLKAHTVDGRLRLLLVGDGSQRGWIHHFISQNSLSDVVLTPGWLPRPELPHWFRAATAYVSCAQSDGTSVSLLEAMATGLPVLVTDIPSNREWVREEANGWLASGTADFTAKLLRVCRLRSGQRDSISQINRKTVASRADWDANFPLLLQLFGRIMDSRAVSA
ncbi:MAG TPA: glycosyltransferase family 4 protein [Terriglobales bacterium]|nr:glycosyltransferase family 4 protein [Terriglobales bacterium]